jgi:hypothetical protein
VTPFALELEHDDFGDAPCTCVTLVGFPVGISVRFSEARFRAFLGFLGRSMRKDLRGERHIFAVVADVSVTPPKRVSA